MIDLSATVLSLAQNYTVRRGTAGTWTDGVYTPGSTSNVTVQAVVVPMGPEEMMRLPEGRRSEAKVVIHSKAALLTEDQSAGTPADILEYQGEDWEVDNVERWAQHGNYYRSEASRRGRG